MSKLDELIAKLCPDGVEYKSLGEIAEIVRGNGLQKSDFTESGVGCIHYGQIYTKFDLFADKTITYVPEELAGKLKKVEKGDLVVAITSENYEDICKCVVWLGDETIVTGGHAAIVKHNQDPKYLAYCFCTLDFMKQKVKLAQGTKVMEISPERLARIKLPVPPIEVQQEIVCILDDFTLYQNELAAKLATELATRKKQYEYYRDKLLTFSVDNPDVKWMKLSDIADIKRGIRVVKKDLNVTEGYPVFQNSLTPLGYYNEANFPAETAFVIGAGAAGEIGYSKEMFWAADDCYCLVCTEAILPRYAYYWLLKNQNYLFSRVRKASVPRLARTFIEDLLTPVPPLAEQERIVDILDRFDKLCNDISEGLPAEIELRRKQYEYYRDKLLTFKVKEA